MPPIQLKLFLLVRLFTIRMRDNVDGASECCSSSLVIASVRVDCGDPGAIVGALSEKELLRRGAKEIVELRGVPNIELKGRPVQFNFRVL